jgi:choline transport protein
MQSGGIFKKDLGFLSLLAAGYNMTNCWLVVAATMTISLPYGPMATAWGVIIIIPVYLCIGLTLAELISAYPTTGGQYHWTSVLAPAKIRTAMVSFLFSRTSIHVLLLP